jgi:hypothetical protein
VSYDQNETLGRHEVDGKQVITLEDYLALRLKHPHTNADCIQLNATAILKLLGVRASGMSEVKRTTIWLRANGFRSVHQGKVFKVSFGDTSENPFYVV